MEKKEEQHIPKESNLGVEPPRVEAKRYVRVFVLLMVLIIVGYASNIMRAFILKQNTYDREAQVFPRVEREWRRYDIVFPYVPYLMIYDQEWGPVTEETFLDRWNGRVYELTILGFSVPVLKVVDV